MAVPDVQHIVPLHGLHNTAPLEGSPFVIKKHKNLPRPSNGSSVNGSVSSGTPDSRRSSSGSTSHTLRHHRRRISGGDLPPTPPAHSRTSSGSQSASVPNSSPFETPPRSAGDVVSTVHSPSTPPNQRSPPTPDVTPPNPARLTRPLPLRPTLYDRIPSKSTTDSRTESFKTAPESPELSDNEDSKATLRPAAPCTRSSQITVRRDSGYSKTSQASEPNPSSSQGSLPEQSDSTPKAKSAFTSFDGDWRSRGAAEQECDATPASNVTVKKRRRSTESPAKRHGDPEDIAITPTNTTKSSRTVPLQGRVLTYEANESPRSVAAPRLRSADRNPTADARRLSGMSSRSGTSTIVEAILVEAAAPRRQKTLRHVRRVDALRDSVWQSPPSSSSTSPQEGVARRRPLPQGRDAPRESFASSSTAASVSSRKARREVRKNGGIPVVIVPDRYASNRSSSQDPSLRSAGSQRSKRSQSAKSVTPPAVAAQHEPSSYFDKPVKKGRRSSESDGTTPGNQPTIDYPPAVPRRTSSLSASTSQNGSNQGSRHGSRAGSLTAESLRALSEAHSAQNPSEEAQVSQPTTEKPESGDPESTVMPVVVRPVSSPKYFALPPDRFRPEHNDADKEGRRQTADTFLGSPMFSTLATPFSQMSVETAGTAPEIAQATAISIVAHQNRSILVVNHRLLGSSDEDERSQKWQAPIRPTITTTEATRTTTIEQPATPSDADASHSSEHMDSPLRNPRVPPQPPILQFIPATPSGLTPAEEKPRLLGNFYEETKEKPSRGMTMVRRALGNRRNSCGRSDNDSRPAALIRRLSLSKTSRDEGNETGVQVVDGEVSLDEQLMDASRLYPEWQPYHYFDNDDGGVVHGLDDGARAGIKYPPIDNRPRRPKRSLSQRMKRTFAIMPLQDQDHDVHDDYHRGARQEMKEKPSKESRRLKHQGSRESLRRQRRRADTNPEMKRGPIFPRSYSLSRGSRRDRDRDSDDESQRNGLTRTWSLTQSLQGVSRRLSEKRREKRSNELRSKISGPRDLRDGVDDVIRRDGLRDAYTRPQRSDTATRYLV
ncbi:hypothetical protein BD289DRAFT_266705 [Coniella lustricola]|uniref:Uncharacterized protein n=1 Tax=Coniella lustricola TaxID=2025994 RepID=A0A2T3A7A8_9PEZI|nr:hypothetical protein BD289DRAFT_266705 [Coniella lustricola]